MSLTMLERITLSLLYGQEQKLHNDIAGGYARGKHLSAARSRQNQVRARIRALEDKRRS